MMINCVSPLRLVSVAKIVCCVSMCHKKIVLETTLIREQVFWNILYFRPNQFKWKTPVPLEV